MSRLQLFALAIVFFGVGVRAVSCVELHDGSACVASATRVRAGATIQTVVDAAGENGIICLEAGTHRAQAIRPLNGQTFYGEPGAILNGSLLLKGFSREGQYWTTQARMSRAQPGGICSTAAPLCNLPGAVFLDDVPLTRVATLDQILPGQYAFDAASSRLYLANDPSGHKVEASVAIFAFGGTAHNVLINNLIIEKYGNPAQHGAISAHQLRNWTVEKSEVRFNNGAGISIGTGGRVSSCNIHHNGQLGIGGEGSGIIIEDNIIAANNTRGFDFGWEAGGVKISGDSVVFRRNVVYDNIGPGLWCDMDCNNVLYENNTVEGNHGSGIFFEISRNAVIRRNRVGNNGIGDRRWFWGADILVAASENVEVFNNVVTVSAGGCGIMLIDQSRQSASGVKYKTQNNSIHDNEIVFSGTPCGGGVSDAPEGDENFAIITSGNNRLDSNLYSVPRSLPQSTRFVWGHQVFNWQGFRGQGLESRGRLFER